MRLTLGTLAGLTAGLMLFTGCTSTAATTSAPATSAASTAATAAGGAQSLGEACIALKTQLTTGTTTMSQAISMVSANPEEAVNAATAYASSFQSTVDSISNAEVKTAAEKAATAAQKVADDLEKVGAKKLDDATDAYSEFTTALISLQTTCAGQY